MEAGPLEANPEPRPEKRRQDKCILECDHATAPKGDLITPEADSKPPRKPLPGSDSKKGRTGPASKSRTPRTRGGTGAGER